MVSQNKKNKGLPIENPRQLAVAFANSVTANTANGNGSIARMGEATLFRALQKILPQVEEITIFILLKNRNIEYLSLTPIGLAAVILWIYSWLLVVKIQFFSTGHPT
jgi:hypothetical protein